MIRVYVLSVVFTLFATTCGGCGKSTTSTSSAGDTNPGVIVAGAGDIACAPNRQADEPQSKPGLTCQEKETSDLLLAINPDVVFTLGDNQYEAGDLAAYQGFYDPTWGRLKAKTKPALGNHEYRTPGAAGYFAYFGEVAKGVDGNGYYSYDLPGWHVVVLNSDACDDTNVGCMQGSPQEQWLRQDLAANQNKCLLAYWHHPRFSSGIHGSNPTYTAFWDDLYDVRADLVLNGHDHDYERFAPQDPQGNLDCQQGIRQFVVGAGGKNLRYFGTEIVPNSEFRDNDHFGVLKLTLRPDGYLWWFISKDNQVVDSGEQSCHRIGAAQQKIVTTQSLCQ